jgi:hypothetical protein
MVAQPVIIFLLLMYPAVDLDHQAYLITIEIRYESVDDLLTAKVKSIQLILADHIPEAFLGEGHLPAECLGEKQFLVVDLLAFNE